MKYMSKTNLEYLDLAGVPYAVVVVEVMNVFGSLEVGGYDCFAVIHARDWNEVAALDFERGKNRNIYELTLSEDDRALLYKRLQEGYYVEYKYRGEGKAFELKGRSFRQYYRRWQGLGDTNGTHDREKYMTSSEAAQALSVSKKTFYLRRRGWGLFPSRKVEKRLLLYKRVEVEAVIQRLR